MNRLTRDGTSESVSRDQILRHARRQGVHFPCSADHEQDWQPYPVDPYSAICDDHTYIHTVHCSKVHFTIKALRFQGANAPINITLESGNIRLDRGLGPQRDSPLPTKPTFRRVQTHQPESGPHKTRNGRNKHSESGGQTVANHEV